MIQIGASLELMQAEQRLARFISTSRTQANRDAGRIASIWTEEHELVGFAGELAFCRMANVYPDLTIGVRPPYDAVLHDGGTVDVKTTDKPHGRLLVLPWKSKGNPPDWYVLMTGVFPVYTYRGAIRSIDLFTTELHDLGHGETFAVRQADLGNICMESLQVADAAFANPGGGAARHLSLT